MAVSDASGRSAHRLIVRPSARSGRRRREGSRARRTRQPPGKGTAPRSPSSAARTPAARRDSRRGRARDVSSRSGSNPDLAGLASGRPGRPSRAASRRARRPVLSPTRFSSSPTFKVVDTLRQAGGRVTGNAVTGSFCHMNGRPGRNERRCRGASADTIIGWISATLAGVGPSGVRYPPLPFVAANATLTGSGRPSVGFLSPPLLLRC